METKTIKSQGTHTLDGTLRVFLAESLILPTGLVTLAFLTRRLGTSDYGLFTLAVTVVAWVEWSLTTMFARAVNKCVSESADWQPVATTALRLYLAVSAAAAGLVMAAAEPVAALLGEPALAGYLRLLALDIPLFCAAHAHRSILIGTGGYRQRAWLSASRWTARLVLMVVLVGAGLSVNGAVAAVIGASVVELAVARRFVRVPWRGRSAYPVGKLLGAAAPLFLVGICLRLFDKLDLFLLKALGASAAVAGVYGAAQNLSVVPGLFAMSFAPLLLGTLTRLRRDGQEEHARAMGRDAMRLVILLVPFAAMAAGAAPEIVRLVAGAEFAGATGLLRWLIFGALGVVLISVATTVLVADDRSWWTLVVAGPTVALAAAGQLWAIPRWGALGAAAVTTACAWLGAVTAVVLASWHGRGGVPAGSVARSMVVSAAAGAVAWWWPMPGWLVVVKLAVMSAGVLAGYLALGELDARERALARSLIPWTSNSRS